MGKINVSYKIMSEDQKKYGNKKFF